MKCSGSTLFAVSKMIFNEINTFLCGNFNLQTLSIYNGYSINTRAIFYPYYRRHRVSHLKYCTLIELKNGWKRGPQKIASGVGVRGS